MAIEREQRALREVAEHLGPELEEVREALLSIADHLGAPDTI